MILQLASQNSFCVDPLYKNLILLHASNKGTDHPVHLHSLISAFVTALGKVQWLNLIATCNISIF